MELQVDGSVVESFLLVVGSVLCSYVISIIVSVLLKVVSSSVAVFTQLVGTRLIIKKSILKFITTQPHHSFY